MDKAKNTILLENLTHQVELLGLRYDRLEELFKSVLTEVKDLNTRMPHRKQGFFGGYWDQRAEEDKAKYN